MTNRPSILGELRFYAGETSWRESIGLLLWRPFVCRLQGHEWQEHKWFEEDVLFTPSEHWRMCDRCERYEDLLDHQDDEDEWSYGRLYDLYDPYGGAW